MHVIDHKSELIRFLDNERLKGNNIGFIPTMGALHAGHLRLLEYAQRDCESTVCSIFVNPVQFNNAEDLVKYPRSLEEDLASLDEAGCRIAYVPPVREIYDDPDHLRTYIHFGEIEGILEGRFRPGHFRGVGLVVAKLFNIVQPDYAYFGQKDLQQLHLIKQLIKDLNYRIRLVPVPTERESDGLAMSSRNRRISTESRPLASSFYKALLHAGQLLREGHTVNDTRKYIIDSFNKPGPLSLEYFEVVDTCDFSIIDEIRDENETALCIAGYIDNIRLIDNVMYNNL